MKKSSNKLPWRKKIAKAQVREYERCVDQMSLAEKRCQIDKSDLRNQLKQSKKDEGKMPPNSIPASPI
jgi:hypothetical protein